MSVASQQAAGLSDNMPDGASAGGDTTASDIAAPKKDDLEALFIKLEKRVLGSLERTKKWRIRAREEFAFITGTEGQWRPEEIQKLNDESRPVITFNKTLKFVQAICGVEANNRQDIIFLPTDVTTPGKVAANEMLSTGSQWMAESCDAPREQSRAFRDTVICGMGWTEGTIEYDVDPRGAYVERRVDAIEMFWDTSARDPNLKSSKFRGRVRKMTLAEARELIPGVTDDEKFSDEDLDATWCADLVENVGDDKKTQQQKEKRQEDTTADYDDDREVHIVQIQWWEYETYFRTVDLRDQSYSKLTNVSPDQMGQMEQAYGRPLPKSKLRRRVYKEAIIGGRILWTGPCKRADGFTFNCATNTPDDRDGMWFGVVRLLRDPQEWSNKFFSQLMHMVNSTAKGGIMAEEGAFSDVRQAERTWARTANITITSKGALANGLIQPKPGAAVGNGVIQLAEMANAAFTDVSGINLELLGLADRDQAGVLEAQRKQAAMTILATLFDGYSGMHRDIGLMRLYFLQNYLADDRLIRIRGDDGYQVLQLIKGDIEGRFDVIVDDAPTSPNAKEKIWAALQPLMPLISQSKEAVAAVLDYVPHIPEKLVELFRKILTTPNPAAQNKQAQDAAEQQSEIDKNNAAANASTATAVLSMAKAGVEHSTQTAVDFANMLQAAAAGKMRAMGLVPAPDDAPAMASPGFGTPMRPPLPTALQAPQPAAPAQLAPPQPAPAAAPAQSPNVIMPGGLR